MYLAFFSLAFVNLICCWRMFVWMKQTSDKEERSLKKTRTDKRPKDTKKKAPLSSFSAGQTLTGKVVSIMPYGAFVDIGTTTDGLVHVSQLADEFVSDISAVVKVGDDVQVRITGIDAEANKISLSMRSENAERKPRASGPSGEGRTQTAGGENRPPQRQGGGGKKELPDEYKNFDQTKLLKGKVANIMEYGCFVSLDGDVDALVHVSEMSEDRGKKPEELVTVGQEVSPA